MFYNNGTCLAILAEGGWDAAAVEVAVVVATLDFFFPDAAK
jgi:hypothetical protein